MDGEPGFKDPSLAKKKNPSKRQNCFKRTNHPKMGFLGIALQLGNKGNGSGKRKRMHYLQPIPGIWDKNGKQIHLPKLLY